MNKTIRFLLILALLVGVVVVAGSQTVWASPAPAGPAASAPVAPAAPADATVCVGTVCVIQAEGGGACGGEHLIGVEYEGICGIATVRTLSYGTDIKAYASQGGTLRLEVLSGSAEICFAAPKNGQIWFQPVQNDNDWFLLATNVLNGKACATVGDSGKYKFVVFHD